MSRYSLRKTIKTKKRFGQHFLKDPFIIQRIVSAFRPHSDSNIVEIGPGYGAMTREILVKSKRLHVIELDRTLIGPLKDYCQDYGELDIHIVDVLEFDFSSLATEEKQLRLIGNLPYNISSPLLFHCFQTINVIKDMHFMLQKEVTDRMTASHGDSNYGRLSVMVQYFCHAEKLFSVPAEAFQPPPKIESAMIRLLPKHEKMTIAKDYSHFAKLVQKAFNQRRKTIRNSLKDLASSDDLESVGIDPSLRPQMISLDCYIKLSDFLVDNSLTID